MVKKIIGRAALKAAKAALKKGKASDGKRTQVLKRVRAAAQLDEAPMSAKQVQQKERNFTLNFKNIKAHRNKYSDAELRQLINKIDDSRPNVKRAEYRQALRESKPTATDKTPTRVQVKPKGTPGAFEVGQVARDVLGRGSATPGISGSGRIRNVTKPTNIPGALTPIQQRFLIGYRKRQEQIDKLTKKKKLTSSEQTRLNDMRSRQKKDQSKAENLRAAAQKRIDKAEASGILKTERAKDRPPTTPPKKKVTRTKKDKSKVGDKYTHKTFGKGTITKVNGENVTIDFENVGSKRIKIKTKKKTFLKRDTTATRTTPTKKLTRTEQNAKDIKIRKQLHKADLQAIRAGKKTITEDNLPAYAKLNTRESKEYKRILLEAQRTMNKKYENRGVAWSKIGTKEEPLRPTAGDYTRPRKKRKTTKKGRKTRK